MAEPIGMDDIDDPYQRQKQSDAASNGPKTRLREKISRGVMG